MAAPRKAKNVRRSIVITMRVSPDELRFLNKSAKSEKTGRAEWIRRRALAGK